jgi:hypothetical protein
MKAKKKKKKVGRPPKRRAEQTPEYWEKQLHDHRLGMNRAEPRWRVLGCKFVNENGETVSLESFVRGESITRQTGPDESIALPASWLRYLDYMDIIGELLSPEDQGAAFKELMLMDARSRREEQPIDFSCAGPPAEFRARCDQSRVEIRLDTDKHIINIIGYPLLPDEP